MYQGHEDWSMQSTVVESPIVKRPGIAPAPMHTIFASHGTTKNALEELENAKDNSVPVKTKMGRDIRR